MPKKSVIKKNALAPTILIAGGAGFIGSHLCETLLQKDARVVVVDNFKTGKENFISHLINNPKFAVYNSDISKGLPEEIESVDYIIHLAGLEEYLYSKIDINLDSLLTNALGTKNLLDLANRSLAKFLLVSTIDVYQGMISQVDLKKYFGDSDIEEKQYSQTEAKRFAEALVWEYYKKNSTNVRIVRVPEVFGPRMDYGSTGELGRILRDVTDGHDLTIYGDGTEKQYYLYITDAVSGILKALFNPNTETKIYPLVDVDSYSPLEITFLIKGLANRELKVNFKPPYRDLFSAPNIPDTSSLDDLGWDAKTSFKEGVIKTLKWGGYDVNENSFKPAKLIDDLKKQKAVDFAQKSSENFSSVGAVSSLVDIVDPVVTKKSNLMSPEVSTKKSFSGLFSKKPLTFNKSTSIQTPPKVFPPNNNYVNARKSSKILGPLYLIFVTLLFVAVVFIGIPVAQTFINAGRAVTEVTRVKAALTELDSEASLQSARDAYVYFSKAQKSLNKIDWLFSVSGKTKMYNSLSDLFSSLTYFSRFSYSFSKGANPYTRIWDAIQPTNPNYLSDEEFSDVESNFVSANESLQFALTRSNTIDSSYLPDNLKDNVETYKQSLQDLSSYLEDVFQVASEVPNLLGTESPKKYLVLFQNSNEIRPTGGFIGSYATLTLDKGKIKELNIDDIYNPDGQLDVKDIKFDPDITLAEILKEDRAYIRNSNWDPDFRQSSEKILKLFFAATGQNFDGVIGVDLKFAESLLKVTGPVFLTAYNEEISAANMYERAQFHSEFNYKDGSDQKKSFLTVLGSKLLERVFSLEQKDMPLLLNEMSSLFLSKDILVYLPNTRVGSLFNKYGWDGSMRAYDKDYLYVVNSNVGGTKANYYVKNFMDYKVTSQTRDGVLRGELALTYEHTGVDSSWPSGPYTNYVRIYVPSDAKLTGAKVNTNNVFDDEVFEDIVESAEGNYKYFSYLLKVEPTQRTTLTISYDLSRSAFIDKGTEDYSLVWQKQPGTANDGRAFNFVPPFGINIESVSANVTTKDNVAAVADTINSDSRFQINFAN